jgi:WD40 repeat protein
MHYHGEAVYALAWAPGGRLASGGRDGTVRIWPADGGGSPQMHYHGEAVYALAWAPGGRLASGGRGSRVRIWPADGGGSPQTHDHGENVRALAWAPDGRLASGGSGGEVRIWRVSGQSDELPGLQLLQSEFRFDRPCDALAVWSDRIACATGGSLALLRIIGHDETVTGV